jgi:flagellar L-ring protein precursor FlgH
MMHKAASIGRRPRAVSVGRRPIIAVSLAAGVVIAVGSAGSTRAESLYDESTYRSLAGDIKAYRIGDAITVQVIEQSSGTTSTDTTTQRANNLTANAALNSRQLNGTLAFTGSFDGGGTTQRSTKLLATLTVTVRDILPNGDLVVAGGQILTVNNEQHKAILQGRIRPGDISGDNVVQSTRIADAHIEYVGDGDLSERQKPGFVRRLLDDLGF